jgi:hypothetical protein
MTSALADNLSKKAHSARGALSGAPSAFLGGTTSGALPKILMCLCLLDLSTRRVTSTTCHLEQS